MADAVYEMKAMELSRSFSDCKDVNETPHAETAIWVLESHLDLVDEFRTFDFPKDELDFQAMVTHARLAREWTKLGELDEVNKHVTRGLQLTAMSDNLAIRNIESEEDFLDFASGIDDPSKWTGNWRSQERIGTGNQSEGESDDRRDREK
jgi:hypothetical protein